MNAEREPSDALPIVVDISVTGSTSLHQYSLVSVDRTSGRPVPICHCDLIGEGEVRLLA